MTMTTRSPVFRRRTERRKSPIAGAATLLLLAGAALGAPAAATAADVIVEPVVSGSTSEISYTIEHLLGQPVLELGTTSGQSYSVHIVNLSAADVRLGISVDVRQQGVIEDLWVSDFLTGASGVPGEAVDPASLIQVFSPTVGPGDELEMLVPDWPGFTYVFQQLDPAPQILATVVADGLYVPFFHFDLPDGGITTATVSGTELFAGLTATVSASGLPPGQEFGVWMAPGLDYFSFLFTGAVLEPNAFEAGRSTVAADGSFAATVAIPPDTPLGQYQLVIGDPTTRSWPAGTRWPFEIVQPQTSASAPTAPGADVATSLAISGSIIGLTFDGVDSAGDTTVTSSGTGPLLAGFQFATDPAEYLHIDTTASFSGDVEVCIAFDPVRVPTTPRLYHFADGAWVDITTLRESGRVCGLTDSFSPFVLGIPNGVELANKQQCKDGGWRTSTLPRFGTQGACVSWFQARGR